MQGGNPTVTVEVTSNTQTAGASSFWISAIYTVPQSGSGVVGGSYSGSGSRASISLAKSTTDVGSYSGSVSPNFFLKGDYQGPLSGAPTSISYRVKKTEKSQCGGSNSNSGSASTTNTSVTWPGSNSSNEVPTTFSGGNSLSWTASATPGRYECTYSAFSQSLNIQGTCVVRYALIFSNASVRWDLDEILVGFPAFDPGEDQPAGPGTPVGPGAPGSGS